MMAAARCCLVGVIIRDSGKVGATTMNTIGLKRYRIIFYGGLLPEADPLRTRELLRQRYQLDARRLEACFSGRKVALQTNLDETDAYRIQNELEDIGLITQLELTHTEDIPAPVREPLVHHPAPAKETANTQPLCPGCQCPVAIDQQWCRDCTVRRRQRFRARLGVGAAVLVLVAAAGALALKAMPLYQRFKTHAQVADGIDTARQIQPALREFIDRTGFWPNSNLDAGLPAPASFSNDRVAELRIGTKALITIVFQPALPDIGGTTLMLLPQRNESGEISWRCDGGTLPDEYLPEACRAPDEDIWHTAARPAPEPISMQLPSLPTASDTLGPSPARIKRLLSDTIQDTTAVRRSMLESMLLNGEWPANNSQANVPAPRRIGPAAFRRIEVQPEGRLVYEFSDQFPELEGYRLTLVPTAIGEWRCETSLPEQYIPADCGATIR